MLQYRDYEGVGIAHSLPSSELVCLSADSANWKNFVGDEFKTFLQRFGTIHCTTQLYQPEPNGKIERVHFIIDNNIRDLMNSFIKMH